MDEESQPGLDQGDSLSVLDWIGSCRGQELTVPTLEAALVSQERYRIGYWDAAVIEAARAVGCRDVLSEDLQDGRDYNRVRIANLFRGL